MQKTTICKFCGKEFVKKYNPQKYCSDECKKEGRKITDKNKVKRDDCICEICGKQFSGNKGNRFCSDVCREIRRKNRASEVKEIKKKCIMCNKEFLTKHGSRKFCSEKCLQRSRIENPKIVKECNFCGNVFYTYISAQKYCCKECHNKSMRWGDGFFSEDSELGLEKRIHIKYGAKFSYSGRTKKDNKHTVCLECKDCGAIVQIRHYTVNSANVSKPSNIKCTNCENILKDARNKAREKELKEKEPYQRLANTLKSIYLNKRNEERQKRRIELDKAREIRLKKKEERRKVLDTEIECVECGKKFKPRRIGLKCCSKECSRRRENRSSDKRLFRNGKIDRSITLSRLLKRDNNICHICGNEVDVSDFIRTKEGYFIAGNMYPSIDHVLPLAKGGKHQWDNVKIAHRICNSNKSDNIYYEDKNNQIRISI